MLCGCYSPSFKCLVCACHLIPLKFFLFFGFFFVRKISISNKNKNIIYTCLWIDMWVRITQGTRRSVDRCHIWKNALHEKSNSLYRHNEKHYIGGHLIRLLRIVRIAYKHALAFTRKVFHGFVDLVLLWRIERASGNIAQSKYIYFIHPLFIWFKKVRHYFLGCVVGNNVDSWNNGSISQKNGAFVFTQSIRNFPLKTSVAFDDPNKENAHKQCASH